MDEPKRWTNRSGRVPVPTKQTKQLFLDLGQKSFGHVTCATCGLLYAKGEREDERTHAAYHAAHVEAEGSAPSDAVSKNAARRLGGKFGIACPRRWGFESAAWHSPDGSEWVVVCGRRDHAKRRAVALKIAAHVERMLGMRAGWALENEKAKMFVRVAGDRAVGALIAEPVSGAFRTVPDARGDAIQHERENAERENANAHEHRHGDEDDERVAAADFRSITRRGDTRERATLGVRALWTHPARRRCGVASQLLDTARHGMTAGYVSGERECAFTQPTEAGKRFARKACGREDGTFLVYLPD
jgi:N-acetyltransferase